MASERPIVISTGQIDFSGGVNSIKVPTIQSAANPNGMAVNELPWLDNGTVRDGGITQRLGWQDLGKFFESTGFFQGGYLYEPDNDDPYLIVSISGHIYQVTPASATAPVDLSTTRFVNSPVPAWTVELKNLDDPEVTATISPGPLYHGPLGDGPNAFTPFVVPAIGGTVVVTLQTFFTGHIGDIISVSGYSWEVVAYVNFVSGTGTNPADTDYSYFCQAEQFLVIQAGDGVTLPLIWDGTILRRSRGITNTSVTPGTPGVNEIPPALQMDYYMGRLWYAQGRTVSAGDIVKGAAGTIAYGLRDSVLNVTENPLVVGGDGFTVPTGSGNIRALKHSANLDTTLGQGQLYIFTRKAIYALTVPITRNDWINSTDPQMRVVQLVNGAVNDRSVVAVNGDLYYQSLEPGIRSLVAAVRYFRQPGNIQISAPVQRVLQFNDRGLMHHGTGTYFNNRMLQSALPTLLDQGVVHKALIPYDFVPLSTPEAKAAPNWEGIYEGLQFLQLWTGDFGGHERCFAAVISDRDSTFHLWEVTDDQRFEDGDKRVTWFIEFPAYTWGQEFLLKRLVSAELWIDKIYGEVVFQLEYRPDSDPCWKVWHLWTECTARTTCENVTNPVCYPADTYRESYRTTVTMPKPPVVCESPTGRPSNIGYQFQCRLIIKGWCRIRGFRLIAETLEKKLYSGLVC